MRTPYVLLTLLAVFENAYGVDSIRLNVPHDDPQVREHVQEQPRLKEAAILLAIVESLAMSDRTKDRTGLEFPNCFQGMSKEEVEKRLGSSVKLAIERYARPCAGASLVFPLGSDLGNIETIEQRSAFYELKDVGGILVYYSTKKVAISPAIVYLQVDESFVPLRRMEDLIGRIEWEVPRLRKLRVWLQIPEDAEKDEKGDFRIKRMGNTEAK